MTDILRLSIPLTFWLAAFSAIYGLQGLVCSDRWAEAGLNLAAGRWALTLAALLSLAMQGIFLWALRSPRFGARSAFVRSVSMTLGVVALLATFWTLLPVISTSLCL